MASEGERPVYSIGAVARMLNVPAATLRAWEERYSLITPARSSGAQRLYSRVQVERLRHLKAQVDAGISPADAHRLLADELAAGHVPHAAADEMSEESSRPLILIAEKDPYAADLTEYLLRTEGFEVATALNATQATMNFEERSPDIVLMDIGMPGRDGIEATHAIHGRDPGQHVVIYTGSDEYGDVARADDAGAVGYLHKGALTSPDLADALQVLHANYVSRIPDPE